MSYVKMFLYGPAGHGKTRFTADAPKPKWYDFENSTETLEHIPEYSSIPVVKNPRLEDLVRFIQKDIRDPEVETVVIDTVTSALEGYLRDYMEKQKQKRDKYVPYEGDYKYATNVFSDLFVNLVRADINVVVIGHDRFALNDEGRIIRVFPGLTPKLQEVAKQLFNVVAYLKLKPSNDPTKRERELYVNPTGMIEAKNRLNIQDTFIKNPEWKNLYNE